MQTQITAKLITRLFGTALIAVAMLGGQAFADGPPSQGHSTVVKFGDLNLDSSQGVAALYRRIHNAAMKVCGLPSGDELFREVRAQENKCVVDAEVRAIGHINNVALEAYYSKKTGRPMPVLASNQK
jgi:UrcA family protein